MIPPELRNLTEANRVIRVAIVSEPETNFLAESIERSLTVAKGFTFSRSDCRSEFGIKPDAARLSNPDVVVGTLGAFQANTERFVLSLRRAFPDRAILVTTTHP